ncbi:hypothetical protein ACTFIW_009285 [Dictyostelium discoideum]
MIDNYFNYLSQRYEYYLSRRDERVLNWPLLSRPNEMIYLIIGYVIIVKLGQKIMKNKKPFELKYPLIIHNAVCTLLSLYMTIEIAHQAISNDYSPICNPVDYSEKGIGMAKVLWLFYFSKFVEFMDTFFMVLRKKDNQITCKHVWHHSTMPILWWLDLSYVGGGDSFLSAMVNSIIHTIMYSYYTLALFGINVWWKKYLTQIQLIQFAVNLSASAYSIYYDCNFIKFMHWCMIVYMLGFLVLFGAFYKNSYPTNNKSNTHNKYKPKKIE